MTTHNAPQREYVQALYDRVIGWYEGAERKAQLILTLDGVFLSFVSASVFKRASDLKPITKHLGPDTWAFLALMAICLVISIVSAVVALRSRLYSERSLKREFTRRGVNVGIESTYLPGTTFFFQHLAALDPAALAQRLSTTDASLAVASLAENVVPLAQNVVRKHRWVNRGFLFSGAVLVFFLAAVVSYLLRAS